MARSIPISVRNGTEDSAMRFTFITRFADALLRNPQRVGGLAFGVIMPLLVAGLVLAPRVGGLSDSHVSSAPQAYIIPVD